MRDAKTMCEKLAIDLQIIEIMSRGYKKTEPLLKKLKHFIEEYRVQNLIKFEIGKNEKKNAKFRRYGKCRMHFRYRTT